MRPAFSSLFIRFGSVAVTKEARVVLIINHCARVFLIHTTNILIYRQFSLFYNYICFVLVSILFIYKTGIQRNASAQTPLNLLNIFWGSRKLFFSISYVGWYKL